MARRLASCPWEWPPMPSATTYRSIGKIRPLCVQVVRSATRLSSFGLDLRTMPVSQPMPTSSTATFSVSDGCTNCSLKPRRGGGGEDEGWGCLHRPALVFDCTFVPAYSKGSRTASARILLAKAPCIFVRAAASPSAPSPRTSPSASLSPSAGEGRGEAALEFPERGRERCQVFAAVFCPRWSCLLTLLYHQCRTAANPAHNNTHQRASQVSENATRPSRGNRIAAPRILNR